MFRSLMLLVCVQVFVSLPVLAATDTRSVESRFGVVLHLPTDWRQLTAEELAAVDDADAGEQLELPPQVRERLSRQVRGGGLELIFNAGESKNGFYDNITLFETRDQVPEAASQIKSTCSALPGLLSRTLGRSVQLEECRGLELGGYPAFVLAYPGHPADTRIVQYMLQLEQNRSLVLTLTYSRENPQSLQDFEQSLKSIQIN
ncbi:hypothetical protein SAMN02745752_00782 [Marinospirillum alkaliphilum DSM 21637]|uniref:DUF1795 domain-containing protein n=2 Tax=Marinospirillum TaxID=64968 RepID=A0A1K1V4Y2_9GAMM|nr:hypothetical protein SAMN02745752_00782 [Marinospirillum alkaliphilum DSM 21637]